MSKLFKLKKWLTVADAAKHLSIVLGESVNEADVLRLALDNHLKLSVDFVNKAKASHARIAIWDETESTPADQKLFELTKNMPEETLKIFAPLLHALNLGSDEYLKYDDDIKSISGVWDLMMVGYERLEVEERYQLLTNGPPVTFDGLTGAFVTDGRGTVCTIQDDLDDYESQPGSSAQLEAIKKRIAIDEIQGDEAAALLSQHKQWPAEFLAKRKSNPRNSNFCPAGGLPIDSVLVVRTEALNTFEQSLAEDAPPTPTQIPEKPLDNRERKSAAQIMSVLASMANLDISAPFAADTVLRFEAATAGLELPASSDTIAKFLSAAAELKAKK